MDRHSVLIIEDEEQIAEVLTLHLRDNGFDVVCANDGLSGLTLALKQTWNLIVLDLNLPKLDGLEVCEQVRQTSYSTPIILVSARSSELDRVKGLNLGADDYITKPFSINEFIARVNAVLRRSDGTRQTQPSSIISANGITLDPNRHTVLINESVVTLTRREFDLLHTFVKSPGRVFNRSELLRIVWGYTHDGYLHTVNSHINRLRSKIEPDPSNPTYIQTVWGVGYKLSV